MAIQEQNDGIVALDGDCGKRLPILDAWVNSSAAYWFVPSFPAVGMELRIGDADSAGWAARITMQCHPKRGLWRAYVRGEVFTERCETAYMVVSKDEYGADHVEGEGILRVRDTEIGGGS